MLEHITELRDMIKKSTEHELLALKRQPHDHPIKVGIEIHSLLQTDDPQVVVKSILTLEHDDPKGRDVVDADLLESAPEFHRIGRFPKVVIDAVYNGSIHGKVPYVIGYERGGGYVQHAVNQWVVNYSAWTGVPRIEAKEPCSVLMYTDVMHKDEEGARPPPTEWHWHPSTIGPEMPLPYMPDAVLVDTQVYMSGMPSVSKDVEDKGKLVYNAFGTDKKERPMKDTLEPHRPNNGSYVQGLTWMLVGWLHKEEPEGSRVVRPGSQGHQLS